MAKIQFVEPNIYTLDGKNIHVSYSTSGIDGKPHFTYQDLHQNHSFSGDQIRRVETEIGTIVSVTIRLTIDSGGTTFSVLLPRVNLLAAQSLPIHTEGITTVHRFSILPVIGQRDFYTVTPLSGTAAQVFF